MALAASPWKNVLRHLDTIRRKRRINLRRMPHRHILVSRRPE
jgi:hypothetical protein